MDNLRKESASDVTVGKTAPANGRGRIAVVAAALVLLAAVVVGVWYAARLKSAQGPRSAAERVYRIGILNGLDYFGAITDGFKGRMAELGYVEGVDVVYDEYAAPAPVGNAAAVRGLIDAGADLLLAYPTEASLEAKEAAAGTGVPVVAGTVLIEGNDFADSVGRPGGDVTGVNYGGTGIAVKRLEILHAVVPEARRVLVPCMKDYPTVAPVMAAVRSAAEPMGISLVEVAETTVEGLKASLDGLPLEPKIDAVLEIVEPFSAMPDANDVIWRWADERGIPVSGALVLEGDTGPLFGFVPDTEEMGRMAAAIADEIIRGTPAGSIPMLTAEGKLELNLKVAQKFGLVIGPNILGQARRVVR